MEDYLNTIAYIMGTGNVLPIIYLLYYRMVLTTRLLPAGVLSLKYLFIYLFYNTFKNTSLFLVVSVEN